MTEYDLTGAPEAEENLINARAISILADVVDTTCNPDAKLLALRFMGNMVDSMVPRVIVADGSGTLYTATVEKRRA